MLITLPIIMESSIICGPCSELFSFARPDLAERIKVLKQEAVEDAMKANYSDADIATLKLEAERYKCSKELMSDTDVPCPWNPAGYPNITFPTGERLNIWDTHQHRRSWKQLCESATATCCQLCISLLSMVNYAIGGEVSPLTNICSVWFFDKGSFRPSTLRFDITSDKDHNTSPAIVFFHVDDVIPEKPTRNVFRNCPFGYSTKDKECTDFFSWVFNDCLEHHPECFPESASNWTPARLLDLQPQDNDIDHVRLVEKCQIINSVSIKYAALSHVWGSHIPLSLSYKNYMLMSSGIPDNILPQCYQDAVHIARRLGIRHLWIDSLCIIQDSRQDWEQQATEMGDVYSRAVCTIAASTSHNSDKTFFAIRNPQVGANIKLQQQFCTGITKLTLIPDWVKLTRDYATLYHRGWIVQERFLSRRLLNFSDFPFWECRRALVTETYLQESNRPSLANDFSGSERIWLHCAPQDTGLILSRWFRVVQIFSQCRLTISDDKLVAISGLAKCFAQYINEPYYAGIWGGRFLVPCLLWLTLRKQPVNAALPMPPTYRAPSWSWASLDRNIYTSHRFYNIAEDFIHVIQASTVPKSNDYFGQIIGGTLQLKGRLFRIADIDTCANNLVFDRKFHLDQQTHTNSTNETYFLPLAKVTSTNNGSIMCQGLIVQAPSPQTFSPKFRRVGLATFHEPRTSLENCTILDDNSWGWLVNILAMDELVPLRTIVLE